MIKLYIPISITTKQLIEKYWGKNGLEVGERRLQKPLFCSDCVFSDHCLWRSNHKHCPLRRDWRIEVRVYEKKKKRQNGTNKET